MTTTMKRGRAKKRSLLRWIAFFLLSISVLARAKSVSDDDDKDDDDWSPMRRAKAAVASNEAKVEEEENKLKRKWSQAFMTENDKEEDEFDEMMTNSIRNLFQNR